MRPEPTPKRLERGRMVSGALGSDASYGFTGAFLVKGPRGKMLRIISNTGETADGWEHVSVSTDTRTPRWDEMCFVKNLYWDDDETVIQFHPPLADYVNFDPHCLHLWKPPYPVPLPDPILVGPKK